MGLPHHFIFEKNYVCLMTHSSIFTRGERVELDFHSSTGKCGKEKMPLSSSDDVVQRLCNLSQIIQIGLQERKQMRGGVELIKMRAYRSCITAF